MTIVLIPFQDTILRATPLRQMGASFAVVPLMLLMILDALSWLAANRKRADLRWAAVGLYCAFITAVYLLLFGADWFGVNLVLKGLNIAIMSTLAVWVVFRPRWATFPYLRPAVAAAFAITVMGVLMNDLDLLGTRKLVANSIFHLTPNDDIRWHGLTSEVSMLSVCLGSLGLLYASFIESTAVRWTVLTTTVGMLACAGSKGGVLTLAVAGVLLCLLARRFRLRILLCAVALTPLAYVAYLRLQEAASLEAVSQGATTFASRSALAVWSVLVVMHHPFGVGFSGFFPALTRYLPDAMDIVSRLSPVPMNFEEVRDYTSAAQFAAAKTLLFNFSVYFGLPFVAAFAVFVGRLVKACLDSQRMLLLLAVLFVTIAACTYYESLVHFNVFLVYGIAWAQHRQLQAAARSR
jgi:hypothetical protein